MGKIQHKYNVSLNGENYGSDDMYTSTADVLKQRKTDDEVRVSAHNV